MCRQMCPSPLEGSEVSTINLKGSDGDKAKGMSGVEVICTRSRGNHVSLVEGPSMKWDD